MSLNQETILVVEDQESIRNLLKLNLELDGFTVIESDRGDKISDLIATININLVVLDVMLPGKNGIEVCRDIKKERPELPIIMLSALDQSSHKIEGLKAGSDDYVAKPFNYEELLLRIQKQLEKTRTKVGAKKIVELNGLSIDFTSNHITKNDIVIHKMNSKESSLLLYLIENKNRVVSRKEIFANVWGYVQFPNSRTVDNHIASLRKVLSQNGNSPIQSKRGVGYSFVS